MQVDFDRGARHTVKEVLRIVLGRDINAAEAIYTFDICVSWSLNLLL